MIIQEAQNTHKNNSIKHLATTQELPTILFFNEKILFTQYLTINNIRILLFKHESFALAYFIDKSYFFNAIQSF
ncbi:hypothetical protein DTL72_25000 [Escherichia coli]|nr:hypothetical protein DTL38_25135 [Escherichia coli]RCY37693.1 hypothetical protein DTL77_24645 [Escherichia coli]RCY47955.1 hypothetical protein DTL72_25000 [Escherichia coli]RCY53288.1 hypothetical protein DTL40_25060 [Escherichia coli]RCY57954.1 hypothetical protein DTL74_25105 [Escherichia coli]